MNRSGGENLIEALIRLLEEEGERLEIVRRKLIEIGLPALPLLKRSAASGVPPVSERAAEIVESIRLEELDRLWQDFVLKEPCSLEEGVFLLARFYDPCVDTTRYRRELDRMAKTLEERIGRAAAPETIIEIVNNYLFHELKFSGNKAHYYLPENSYIHTVLDLKKGIPISLSTIFLLLAERLHLPLYGVGLPGHFLVKWADERREIYIDPFNQGQILTRNEIAAYLTEGGMSWKDEYLEKVSSRKTIARMIRNLIHIYTQEGEKGKGAWLGQIYEWVRLTI